MSASKSNARSPDPGAGPAGTFRLGGQVAVNRMGFGAMRIPGARGGDPSDGHRLLRRAVELGVNFLDTAHAYGRSEELIGQALHPYPEDLFIATKAGYGRDASGAWIADASAEAIRGHVERSLTLLRVERLDLLQLHTIDPRVPIEDSVGAMVELQSEGKVRMIGLSNVGVRELERARTIGEIMSVQNRYSVDDRRSEGVLQVCEGAGIAFLPWFPLGAGALARGAELEAIGSARDATAAQVALAWLLQRSPVMLSIPGTSRIGHLEENVAAAALQLTAEEFDRLDARDE